MKPLNLDNSPCSPISSNCVIWQGPDIPCIKLCKGDTVSDVVHKLATELCTILDTLNITNYDLSCFNLVNCPPSDFEALINFLIQRICELENISTPTPTKSTSCADTLNCQLTAADCFGGGPIALGTYVQNIATEVCNIIDQIVVLQNSVTLLQAEVDALQITVAGLSNYTTPQKVINCDIGIYTAGSNVYIDDLIQAFINSEWCPMTLVLDTSSNLSNAISSQNPCYAGTEPALQYVYTSSAIMQVAYPTYTAAPTTLAESIENIWIALCDLRNAGKRVVTVSPGDNVSVIVTTGLSGNDQTVDYLINGKEAIVAAGDNITVTSATVGNDTTYTIAGKEAIVAAANDITVTPVTVGNDTTYTVGRTPKINYYSEAIAPIQLSSDVGYVSNTYFQPVPYASLAYTNTSGSTKDFLVRVSYDSNIYNIPVINDNYFKNHVDGALFKNGITLLYESAGVTALEGSLYNGPLASDIVNIGTAEQVLTSPSNDPVEFRFNLPLFPRNVSFFKKVSLANGETVELKFKSFGAVGNTEGYLLQAQFYVEEIR
jgi:hypothetical protein